MPNKIILLKVEIFTVMSQMSCRLTDSMPEEGGNVFLTESASYTPRTLPRCSICGNHQQVSITTVRTDYPSTASRLRRFWDGQPMRSAGTMTSSERREPEADEATARDPVVSVQQFLSL